MNARVEIQAERMKTSWRRSGVERLDRNLCRRSSVVTGHSKARSTNSRRDGVDSRGRCRNEPAAGPLSCCRGRLSVRWSAARNRPVPDLAESHRVVW